MNKIFLNKKYEVYEVKLAPFIIGILTIPFITFCILHFFNFEGLLKMCLTLISTVLAFFINFYISKRDLFSDKIIGQILKSVDSNNQRVLENFRDEIKTRLKSSQIILSKENKDLINQLTIVFKTYESCLPIVNESFPNIEETIEVFSETLNKQNTIFEKFDLEFESFLTIFHLNLTFFITHYKTNRSLDKFNFLHWSIPAKLKLYNDICSKPVCQIDDFYYQSLIKIKKELKLFLNSGDVNNNEIKIIRDDQLIHPAFFNYISSLAKLYNEIIELKNKWVYQSLLDVICLIIVAYSLFLHVSIKNNKKDQLEVHLSDEKVQKIKVLKEKFSKQEIIPTLELYRKQSLNKKVNIKEILDFSNQYCEHYPYLVTAIINNYFIAILKENSFRHYIRAYEKLIPFYSKTIKIKDTELKRDYSVYRANFKLLYHFHRGTLTKNMVNAFHDFINSKCTDESKLHIFQANTYRFIKILAYTKLENWYETNSLLSRGEMDAIDSDLTSGFRLGNQLLIESDLEYFCFPVGIRKEDLGNLIV